MRGTTFLVAASFILGIVAGPVPVQDVGDVMLNVSRPGLTFTIDRLPCP